MTETLSDALAYLATISREEVRPREAKERLRALQARHPDVGMELVWEAESYDASIHYDVLFRPGDGTTVSLGCCLDRGLPWPLRGVRRWSDAELAQVNTQILTMQEAVGFLDILWNEAPIMNRMINSCLIREELERQPVEISDAELQVGIDGLRRTHRLYTAADTIRWMEQRGLTHEQLEQLASDSLMYVKLRARVAAGRVERYFEEHREDFDTAHVARIECADDESARRLRRHLLAGELDFLEAAQRQFLAAPDQARALFATLRRRDAPAILAAAPGDVVESGDVVTRVLSVTPATLDEATRVAIEEILFEAWLVERRRTARVTWYWGTSTR